MDFLNEFSKRFANAARSVSEKNRESTEAARIGDELRAASAELEQLFARYGRECYALRAGEGNRAAADALVVKLRKAIEQVESLTARRDEWRQTRRCAACGAAQPRTARFCSSCGKRMPEDAPKPEPAPEAGEYCPDCGAARQPGETVCAVCGGSFNAADIGEPAPAFEPDAALLAAIDVEEPVPGEAE